MADFDDKVVIVTGGGSGVGRSTAIAFAREKARVVVADINRDMGQETVNLASEHGSESFFIPTDVSRHADVRNMIEQTVAHFGQLDYAVNNAAVTQRTAPLAELDEATFDRLINVNVRGVWLCMKYEIPQMFKCGGAVVNVTSALDSVGAPGMTFYTATKHAILGMTRCAALDYAEAGIRFNCVSPGTIDTPMMHQFAAESPEVMDLIRSAHPMKRIAQPDEIANAILFLCSNRASFITGHSLKADGGYTAT